MAPSLGPMTVLRSKGSSSLSPAQASKRRLISAGTMSCLDCLPVPSSSCSATWVSDPRRLRCSSAAAKCGTLDVVLEPSPVLLGEIEVTSATRTPERVVAAPAAVSIVDTAATRALSITGQTPLTLAGLTGVDAVQNGMNDFNVNTRGFNGSLNRRVLVLLDGRDLATSFTGSQEWSALSIPLEDVSRIEMVRGPGSALFRAERV